MAHSNQILLHCWYRFFCSFYACDSKRLNRLKLEKYIQMVKNFTEEREQITLEYKEENSKLKNKIKLLQQNTMNTEGKSPC